MIAMLLIGMLTYPDMHGRLEIYLADYLSYHIGIDEKGVLRGPSVHTYPTSIINECE
jgi:hypothetical protein